MPHACRRGVGARLAWGTRLLCTTGRAKPRQLLSSLQLFAVGQSEGEQSAANPYHALGLNAGSPGACGAWDWVLDVRSPGEHAEDHLQGTNVLSVPVLDDAQRTLVGTEYTRGSRHWARMQGASMISTRIGAILSDVLAERTSEGDRLLVYCWRGGLRSRALATVLSHVGFKVELLEGGYRAYRRAVAAFLEKSLPAFRFVVVSGPTGSGKGRVLAALAAQGGQVLDLEELAMHRGSTFGAMEEAQPRQKFFESKLTAALAPMAPERPIFVESESRRVGACHLPEGLAEGMAAGERVELAVPLAERVRWIRECYSHFETKAFQPQLIAAIDKLTPLLGRLRTDAWRALVEDGRWEQLVEELLVGHYDPAYAKARRRLGTAEEGMRADIHSLQDPAAVTAAAAAMLRQHDPVAVS